MGVFISIEYLILGDSMWHSGRIHGKCGTLFVSFVTIFFLLKVVGPTKLFQ